MKWMAMLTNLGSGFVPVLLMLAGCSSPAYPPPPFERKVDVSKAGVLYEADFSVPYNGSFEPFKLEFGQPHTQYELVLQIADTVPGRLEREQEEAIALMSRTTPYDIAHVTLLRVVGVWGDIDYIGKLSVEQLKAHVRSMKHPGVPIQLKITLTPHPGTHKPIAYATASDYGTGRGGLLAPGEPLGITLDLSTFAEEGNVGGSVQRDKLLLKLPRLELHGAYHLRVENLSPIALPPGIETTLIQRQGRISK